MEHMMLLSAPFWAQTTLMPVLTGYMVLKVEAPAALSVLEYMTVRVVPDTAILPIMEQVSTPAIRLSPGGVIGSHASEETGEE